MSKQINISDDLYNLLNARRHYRGKKYSFNTVIMIMVKETIIAGSSEALFLHMQWQKIVSMLKDMQEEGWYPTYRTQYAQMLRLVINGQFKEAREYMESSLPDFHEPTDDEMPLKD